VFDSVVQGGDAVWEGLRVYAGRKVFALTEHLQRLEDSAHALAFAGIPAKASIRQAIAETLEANGLDDEAHIRLTLTRGVKTTSGMDPRLNQAGCTLIVVAEYKPPVYPDSIRLISSSVRRNSPAFLDSHIHHTEQHPRQDRGQCGRGGRCAHARRTGLPGRNQRHQPLPGPQWRALHAFGEGLPARHYAGRGHGAGPGQAFTLTQAYTADEAFVTGTMGELTRIAAIDGREVGRGVDRGMDREGSSALAAGANAGSMLLRLQDAFRDRVEARSEAV
jgi:branched-subunit amino acid aminotransferase/4-amino-4-deoxychorismate lyase